jgi:hypothetical protein
MVETDASASDCGPPRESLSVACMPPCSAVQSLPFSTSIAPFVLSSSIDRFFSAAAASFICLVYPSVRVLCCIDSTPSLASHRYTYFYSHPPLHTTTSVPSTQPCGRSSIAWSESTRSDAIHHGSGRSSQGLSYSDGLDWTRSVPRFRGSSFTISTILQKFPHAHVYTWNQ